jgi:hypothetical protein
MCVYTNNSFYKSVPNPEPYTNDNDISSYQCLTSGYNKIISIKGSNISNLGTHFNSHKNHKEKEEYKKNLTMRKQIKEQNVH